MLEINRKVVDDIISEYDYIRQLLEDRGRASEDQLDILLFPRTDNIKSNVLQVSGGAGTGKTLVLLAKIIQELQQDDLYNSKKALFVCFNRSLMEYVETLLRRNFALIANKVTVINVDLLVSRIVDRLDGDKVSYSSTNTLKPIIGKAKIKYTSERLPFLDENDRNKVNWISEEIDWIESRKLIEFDGDCNKYQDFGRVGRGNQPFAPAKNSKAREAILEIMQELYSTLENQEGCTFNQAVNSLLKNGKCDFTFDKVPKEMGEHNHRPEYDNTQYDIIAVDEVQDFTLASVKLLLKFRKPGAKFMIAGDDGQKIYKRDFTWKQLGDADGDSKIGEILGHTVSLKQNYRNHSDIERFASRLKGAEDDLADDFVLESSGAVELARKSDEEIVRKAEELSRLGGTTCIILQTTEQAKHFKEVLDKLGISATSASRNGRVFEPGIYYTNVYQLKGLEFDSVLVLTSDQVVDDEKQMRNQYYVAFTRARKFLGVYYSDLPDSVIAELCGDVAFGDPWASPSSEVSGSVGIPF